MHVIDSHTAGEPTRVILDGFPDLGSGPLSERAALLATRYYDDYRNNRGGDDGRRSRVRGLPGTSTSPIAQSSTDPSRQPARRGLAPARLPRPSTDRGITRSTGRVTRTSPDRDVASDRPARIPRTGGVTSTGPGRTGTASPTTSRPTREAAPTRSTNPVRRTVPRTADPVTRSDTPTRTTRPEPTRRAETPRRTRADERPTPRRETSPAPSPRTERPAPRREVSRPAPAPRRESRPAPAPRRECARPHRRNRGRAARSRAPPLWEGRA